MTRALRFYRALLRLYPAGFRAEYGPDMCTAFAARTREYAGPLPAVVAGFSAIGDVVPNAAAAHWDILRQDLRYAARSLGRAPGFAITAVLVVALGIGANTAAFSLADFVLVRPLPFPEPDRLVKLWQRTPGYGRLELSPANYRDWKSTLTSVDGFGAYTGGAVNLVGSGEPHRLETSRVTPELFQLLGVPALVGRTIAPEDSTNDRIIVLSHPLWQTHFAGDSRVVGSVVSLDGEPYTVVGVMPPSFRFPYRSVEAWTPLVFREQHYANRNDNYIDGVARLRDGVSIERLRGELDVITARLEQQYPRENRETRAAVIGMRDELSERARLLVLALCGAALCVLLLACANLASLLLARATHRSREMAVRSALGAGPERLVRQLATESVALSAIGGIVGIFVAVAGLPMLTQLVPSTLPIAEQPSVDLRALGVAAVLAAITALAFGVGPALAAGRSRAMDALRAGVRAGGGRMQRVRGALVIVELAASVVLLIASGLLIRAVMRIQATDPGFRIENILTLRTALPRPEYDLTARREEFYRRVLQDVRILPGVEGAAYVTGAPMSMRGGIWPVAVAGEEVVAQQSNSVGLRFVTPQYFATLGIPLRAGRDVAESDTRDNLLVAVVSESFVTRHWPNESGIGKRFMVAFGERTIVGVVGDVRVRGLERESEPQVYLPSAQMRDSALVMYPPKDLVVRTAGPPGVLLPAIRRIVAAADPEQPISNVRTMAELIGEETASRMTQLRLLAILSSIALLIAGVGIHGLLTFTVARRTHEIGVRRALGEQAGSVVRRVVREGMLLAAAGVAGGVAVGYLGARGMAALLAGVRPEDPATIGIAAALCFATAVAGCLRPAMRAARVDPVEALRGE